MLLLALLPTSIPADLQGNDCAQRPRPALAIVRANAFASTPDKRLVKCSGRQASGVRSRYRQELRTCAMLF